MGKRERAHCVSSVEDRITRRGWQIRLTRGSLQNKSLSSSLKIGRRRNDSLRNPTMMLLSCFQVGAVPRVLRLLHLRGACKAICQLESLVLAGLVLPYSSVTGLHRSFSQVKDLWPHL